MSEIVDIVAAVIDQFAFKPLPGHGPGECQHCDDDRELTRKRAREILTAIREPTSEMLDAGRQLQSIGDETLDHDDMRAKYQAMIDAALNPSATRPAEASAESDRSEA